MLKNKTSDCAHLSIMNTDHPRSTTGTIRGLLRRLPTTVRGHVVAVLGELVGTISFLLFVFAGKTHSKWTLNSAY